MAKQNWANLFNPGILPPGGATVSGMGGFAIIGPAGKTWRQHNGAPVQMGYGGLGGALLDVGEWRGRLEKDHADVTHSGGMSFQDERLVCVGFEFQLSLPIDVMNTPELKLQSGSGVQLFLKISDYDLFYPTVSDGQRFYYAPHARLHVDQTVNDARRAVRYNAMGRSTAVFLLPREQKALTNYLNYLASKGLDGY